MMKKGRAEKQQRKKQGRRSVYYGSIGTPKAVDEDLYKIPPELLYQIPKRVRILLHLYWNFLFIFELYKLSYLI